MEQNTNNTNNSELNVNTILNDVNHVAQETASTITNKLLDAVEAAADQTVAGKMGFNMIKLARQAFNKKPGASQMAARHFDIVIGFDFHFLKTPFPGFPCPVTPFMALIFDPTDYLHIKIPAMPTYGPKNPGEKSTFHIAKGVPMGSTVKVNHVHKATASAGLMGLPPFLPFHFVIPKPIIMIPLFSGHDGEINYGSKTVKAQGSEMSTQLCNALTCTDVGMPLPQFPAKLKKPIPFGMYNDLLSKIMIVIPHGKPVMVGGPFVQHEFTVDDYINRFIGQAIFKAAGKILGKIAGKLKLSSKISARLTNLNKALKDRLLPKIGNTRLRNALQNLRCKLLGDPVDVATGFVNAPLQGFELSGPIPFVWDINYFSNSKYDGPLGKNFYHTYDYALMVNNDEDIVVFSNNDGVGITFTTLQPGESMFNTIEKWELIRSIEGEYYAHNGKGLYYYFHKQKDKDGWQKIRSIVNRNGFAIRFNYNAQGHLIQVIDSAHRTITVENNEQGFITALYLPHPTIADQTFAPVKYKYDAQGRLIAAYNALGHANTFTWQDRFITSRTGHDGITFTFEYDKKGRCTAALGTEGIYSYRFTYQEGCTIVENAVGSKTAHYHREGLVVRTVNSLGGETLSTYDAEQNLIGEQDPVGNVKNYKYDDKGNITEIGLPGGGVTKITYNNFNQPLTVTLANGAAWQYEYDEQGNLIAETNPLGATTRYTIMDGLLKSITNASALTTRFEYNRQYQLIQANFPNGNHVSYAYDAIGRLKTITDPNGNRQIREYDLVDNITEITNPNNTIQLKYDNKGNVIHAKDKLQEVQMSYDFFGNVTKRTQAGTSVQLVYNKEGQLTGVINEHGHRYHFNLDSDGNVIKEVGFDNITKEYIRNTAGQVMKINRPGNKYTQYEYDTAGNVIGIQYHDGATEEYEYDALGQLIAANNEHTEVKYKYNVLGQIIEETQGEHKITHTYDNITNQCLNLQSSLGANIQYAYTKQGFLQNMQAGQWQAQFNYNRLGQEIERLLPGQIAIKHQYDELGNLIKQNVQHASRLTRYRQYTWTHGERITQITDSHQGTQQYRHDALGNLAQVIHGDGSIEYRLPDAMGNLFTSADKKDRQYGKAGQLLKSTNAAYKYDDEGNLIEKREKNGREWQYEWNSAGRLIKVIRPDQTEVHFAYDALGRRMYKRYKHTTTHWVWNGNVPLHEWKTFDAKESSADDIITWVFEQDSFVPSAKLKGNKQYSIVADHLGTPYLMYNDEGNNIWETALDSYGKVKLERGEFGSCPFRYQGQYEDTETGLYYNRFRYYSPEEGIYISQDPIGLAGNNPTLYGYVKDTAVRLDPFGLDAGGYTVKKAKSGTEKIKLYRGINESHIGYNDALKGTSKPRGGNASPLEHNLGNTNSNYTSWTTDPEVAKNFALRPNGKGVVLEIEIPKNQTVHSPNLKEVVLIQSGKLVNEAEVLVPRTITNAKVNPVEL